YFSSSSLVLSVFCFFFYSYCHLRDLHSFPTRRSSDLDQHFGVATAGGGEIVAAGSESHRLLSRGPGEELRDQGQCHQNDSADQRSEEHTSELQSHLNLVCRLLLEKKKKI